MGGLKVRPDACVNVCSHPSKKPTHLLSPRLLIHGRHPQGFCLFFILAVIFHPGDAQCPCRNTQKLELEMVPELELDTAGRAWPAFPACPCFSGDRHRWPHGDTSLASISTGKSQEEEERGRGAQGCERAFVGLWLRAKLVWPTPAKIYTGRILRVLNACFTQTPLFFPVDENLAVKTTASLKHSKIPTYITLDLLSLFFVVLPEPLYIKYFN